MRLSTKGFTLVELIVASVLALMFFGLVISFLVPGMRIYARGSLRAEMQQEAIRTLEKMSLDLSLATFAGVTIALPAGVAVTDAAYQGPIYVGIMRIDDVDTQGTQVLKQNLVVYSWEGPGKEVIRKEWDSSHAPSVTVSFTTPAGVSSSILIQIAQESALQGTILARDVQHFSLDCADSSTTPVPPFIVAVRIERAGATGRSEPEEFSISRSIDLRNQL